MADQLDINTRSPNPDDEIDDPLAELARIIGYERPAKSARTSIETPDATGFDLEAELMRELDVPLEPSVDELDRIEADEALDQALADDEFESEPGETTPAQRSAPPARRSPDENAVDDTPILEPEDGPFEEGRSSGALLQAIENEFPVENRNEESSEEPAEDEDDLTLAWDADDLAPDWLAGKPEFEADDNQTDHDQSSQTTGQRVTAEFGAVKTAAVPDYAGDDVLDDMGRFELPQRGAGVSSVQAGPAARQETRSGADSDRSYNGTVRSGIAAEPAERDVAPEEVQSVGGSSEPPMDFEEYLSTELDVFEHEVALDADGDRRQGANQAYGNGEDEDGSVESALDALNDDAAEDDPSVFDDAAEELLASLNTADEDPEVAPAAEPAEGTQDWSLDAIEESTADELDDELGDMFVLPDRVVDPSVSRVEEADDLELDLEQVLADSFGEDDDDELAAVAANNSHADDDAEPDNRRSEAEQVDRDEMTEAFVGLVPGAIRNAPEPVRTADTIAEDAAPAEIEDHPHEDDWLAGFEVSDNTSTVSSADDYYFDADLISDADDAVEAVGVIDVPELVHDDPRSVDADYETEIEREFADIADRHEPHPDESSDHVMAAGFGGTEVWSRANSSPRGYEVSDDYIALERELGVDQARPGDADGFSGNDQISGGVGAQDETARSGSRGPVLAVAVLAIALLAVAGAFGWSMLSGGDTTADGGPRIIRADKDPVKVLPENPGGVTVPNQDKAVYDRVAGVDSATPGQPALVNSAEEPVDVVQRTLDPEILPLEGRGDAAVKSEDRLAAGTDTSESGTNDTSVPVVSPRKVRTMIVKPDGSIVAREEPEAVAGAEDTPQAAAPAVAALDTAPEPAAVVEPATVVEPAADETEATPAAESGDPALTSIAPVRVVKTQQIRPVANAPVPAGRPANQPVNVVGTVTQGGTVSAAPAASVTAAAPAQPAEVAAAPAAAAPAANPGGYYVQIASQPTPEGAQASWRTLSSRYSSILGGSSVDIQRADIPGKGVFHRVRVPAGSRDQANALCSRYKSAGGSCFVSR